jgi:hypothetical protein
MGTRRVKMKARKHVRCCRGERPDEAIYASVEHIALSEAKLEEEGGKWAKYTHKELVIHLT